jgi:hypothetical protein
VTSIGIFVACLSSAFGGSPASAPTFEPNITNAVQGAGKVWKVESDLSLLWAGEPYRPVGLRLNPSSELFTRAYGKGVRDFIFNVPVSGGAWDAAGSAPQDIRFILAINSLSPMAKGYTVEPMFYRITGIKNSAPISISLPGADEALVVMAQKRDGAVVDSARVPVQGGTLKFELKTVPGAEHVALIYPLGSSLEYEDLWEGFDSHRDRILRSLSLLQGRARLRGILNPYGVTSQLPGAQQRFVPTSPLFRAEFAEFLEEKYKNVRNVLQAWAANGGEFESFDDVARLIPLWSGQRGVALLYDAEKDIRLGCNMRRSVVWDDIAQAIAATRERRFAKFVEAIHTLADVPVLQEWNGWAAVYEGGTSPFDGIGYKVLDRSPAAVVEQASRPLSTTLRWNRPGWFAATNVSMPTKDGVQALLDDLAAIGTRAVYFGVQTIAEVDAFGGDNTTFNRPKVGAVFFPENATNPAFAQPLGGGYYWLPAPFDGNRIDLGEGFYAYRFDQSATPKYALWSAGQPTRVQIPTRNAKKVIVTGPPSVNPDPKEVKGQLEVTIGPIPIVFEGLEDVPVPNLVIEKSVARFRDLVAHASKIRRDIGDEMIMARNLREMFMTTPLAAWRVQDEVNRAIYKNIGPLLWIELERSLDNSFSETVTDPSCSGTGAIILKVPFENPNGKHQIRLTLSPKSTENVDVWLAAKIPDGDRSKVRVKIGGQVLGLAGESIARYGAGFGWYKLGVSRFLGSRAEVIVECDSSPGTDIALDCLVFAAMPFQPRGSSFSEYTLPVIPEPQKPGNPK